jgi:hypothetical protein
MERENAHLANVAWPLKKAVPVPNGAGRPLQNHLIAEARDFLKSARLFLRTGVRLLKTSTKFPSIDSASPIGTRMVPPPGGSGACEKIFKVMEGTMKLKILSLSVLLIFALGMSLSVTSTPASPKAVSAAAATPQPAAAPAAQREPHPEIREAIASLRRAKAHLEHAAHDFGGHRVEAIKATDEAIRHLQDCLKFDKD